MFRFKFVLDYFQKKGASGPTIEANLRAKWLSLFAPPDLEIAFAPYPGQIPLYRPELVKLVQQNEPGWWNHYFFNSSLTRNQTGKAWSLGPNIDLSRPVTNHRLSVAFSHYHKQIILKKWKLPSDQVIVISNMVDTELFYPRKKYTQFTVGWVGYDHPSRMTKGVEVIPYLARQFPHIHFEMIHARKPQYTNEWLPEPLPNLRVEYGISHYQMPQVISRWHVLVCGSKWETFGSHILEAMACGVPVIAAKVGAIPEVASSQMLLENMKWGQPPEVIHPYDWTDQALEQFRDALEKVYQDQRLYAKLREDAIKESKRFSPRTVADQWYKFMYQCRELSKT